MAISLNTNIAALGTQRRLGDSTARLTQSFERLSSGLRISTAGDDAAGLAVSELLRTDSQVYTQGVRNLNDGVSITNIAESTLNELTNIVTRINELAEQAANGTISKTQRASIDAEAQALSKEYFRVSRVAEFNGLRLFDGSTQGLRVQAGYGENGGVSLSLGGKLGTGTVGGSTTFAAEAVGSYDSAMADLNGDGLLDIVTSGNGDVNGNITVALGNGDGTFRGTASYDNATSRTYAVSVADVNGDSILDLIGAGNDASNGRVAIRLGRGDGTFGASRSYITETAASYALKVGDINGDNIVDLVTAGYADGAVGYTTVRLGTGDGTFSASSLSYAQGSNYSCALELRDLNGDGNLDMATVERHLVNAYATTRFGRGDGTFEQATSYLLGGVTALYLDIDVGDLDEDGDLDIVAGAARSGTNAGFASVMLNQGNGSFAQPVSYSADPTHTRAVALADMNGDGVPDLVTGGQSSTFLGSLTIRLGAGDGTFEPVTTSILYQGSAGGNVHSLEVGDLNQDGVLDVVAIGEAFYGGMKGLAESVLGNTRDGVSPLLPFSLKTKTDALQAVSMLSKALQRVSTQRGLIGALQSRLGIAVNNLQVARENFDSARSQITDVDVASESADLLKTQIIQQAAMSILGQANQAPLLALTLLKGS